MLHTSITEKNVQIAQTRFMEDTYTVEIEVSEDSTGLVTIYVRQIALDVAPVTVKFCVEPQEAVCIGGDCRPEWNWRRADCPVHGDEVAAMREP